MDPFGRGRFGGRRDQGGRGVFGRGDMGRPDVHIRQILEIIDQTPPQVIEEIMRTGPMDELEAQVLEVIDRLQRMQGGGGFLHGRFGCDGFGR